MTIRIRTHICSSIAVAAVILAVAAPNAFAATSTGTTITISKWLANFHEPGSTGYVPASTLVTIPKSLANFHEPGSTGYVPASTLVTKGGEGDPRVAPTTQTVLNMSPLSAPLERAPSRDP